MRNDWHLTWTRTPAMGYSGRPDDGRRGPPCGNPSCSPTAGWAHRGHRRSVNSMAHYGLCGTIRDSVGAHPGDSRGRRRCDQSTAAAGPCRRPAGGHRRRRDRIRAFDDPALRGPSFSYPGYLRDGPRPAASARRRPPASRRGLPALRGGARRRRCWYQPPVRSFMTAAAGGHRAGDRTPRFIGGRGRGNAGGLPGAAQPVGRPQTSSWPLLRRRRPRPTPG